MLRRYTTAHLGVVELTLDEHLFAFTVVKFANVDIDVVAILREERMDEGPDETLRMRKR